MDLADRESFTEPENGTTPHALETTSSLEGFQSAEQRNVLNIIDQLRRCGLESTLSLPQLVLCGDQSAGKGSVLEAFTEVPFPRADNLCTRFATEIILRRATSDAITVKVIPDAERPQGERDHIEAFQESISDFDEPPSLMNKATTRVGINKSKAFAKDILSKEIEGPSRPQLTLVDLPGLIQTETRGVSEDDIYLVTEITDHYISQSRTICLAVVSAGDDYAKQGILKKVRRVDPEGIAPWESLPSPTTGRVWQRTSIPRSGVQRGHILQTWLAHPEEPKLRGGIQLLRTTQHVRN